MKTKTKILVGILVFAAIGAIAYFSKTELQKGALQPLTTDHVIQSLTISPAPYPTSGSPFTVTGVVRNAGNVSTGTGSYAEFNFNGVAQALRPVPALAPNAEATINWQTTTVMLQGEDGIYRPTNPATGPAVIQACADRNQTIDETDEINNCRTINVKFLLPPPPPPPPLCTLDSQYTCASWSECTPNNRGRYQQIGSECTTNPGVTCTLPSQPRRFCTP